LTINIPIRDMIVGNNKSGYI